MARKTQRRRRKQQVKGAGQALKGSRCTQFQMVTLSDGTRARRCKKFSGGSRSATKLAAGQRKRRSGSKRRSTKKRRR